MGSQRHELVEVGDPIKRGISEGGACTEAKSR